MSTISLTWALALVVLLVIILLTNILLTPRRRSSSSRHQPKDFTAFPVQNRNGQEIAAWYALGRPGCGALLMCHGHSMDHTRIKHLLPFLREAGLTLILFDFRAHGSSEGSITSIGLNEWEDVAAVIAAANYQGILAPDQPLAAYGCSMGAATLANGAQFLDQIDAFLLESCFSDLEKVIARDVHAIVPWVPVGILRIVVKIGSWRAGTDYLSNRPVERLHAAGKRPVMLIHGTEDSRALIDDFHSLQKVVPGARLLVMENGSHAQCHRADPKRYEAEVLDFLTSAGILPAVGDSSTAA